MRIIKITLIILVFLSILLSCNKKRVASTHNNSSNEQKQDFIMKHSVSQRNNLFSIDIFKNIDKIESENLIISPYSINTALAMTYAGAREETMREMSNVLYYSLDQEKFHPEFSRFNKKIKSYSSEKAGFELANALYAQKNYNFLNEFFEIIKKNYGSVLNLVDFQNGDLEAIRKEINTWVEKQTNSKIQDLITKSILTEDTRLVLVNAIYFLAEWAKEFSEELTYDDQFFMPSSKTTNASFMKTTDSFKYYNNEVCSAIEIPYHENKFSMLILLPEDKEFQSFIDQFDYSLYQEINNKLKTREVEVHIPKFKIKTHMELQTMLAKMGMPLAFSNKADFSGMTGDLELAIDKVIHQAYIEVDEKGTEAAAATAVVIIRKTAIAEPDKKIVFKANKPFLFFIKDNSDNTIVFMGSLVNPS